MKSSLGVKTGILLCSLGVLVVWVLYYFLEISPNIERLRQIEQQEEKWWMTVLWHLPGLIPALVGLFIFKMTFPNRTILFLYLIYLSLFALTYGMSSVATSPLYAVVPLLLLSSINLFLLFYIFDQYRKRSAQNP